MKKYYESPEIEKIKISLSEDVLTISQGESGASGGFIEEPDPDMEEKG